MKRIGDGGTESRMALKMTAELSPLNGSALVAISYNTAPNENRSVRASSSLARAYSGDMYETVPRVEPGLVRSRSSIVPAFTSVMLFEGLPPVLTFAIPKSRTPA